MIEYFGFNGKKTYSGDSHYGGGLDETSEEESG